MSHTLWPIDYKPQVSLKVSLDSVGFDKASRTSSTARMKFIVRIPLQKGIFFELVSNPVFRRFISMTYNSQSPIKLLDCSERHTIRHESDYFRIDSGLQTI